MKTIVALFLFLMLFPVVGSAGEIYGSIRVGKKPIGPGIKVEVIVANRAYPTETDRYGSYRVYTPQTGKGILRVHFDQQSPSIEISFYEKSVRYDLVLEKRGGQYSLRRN